MMIRSRHQPGVRATGGVGRAQSASDGLVTLSPSIVGVSMPHRVVSLAVLGLLVGLAAAQTPRDEPLPPLRQLCLDAPAVVLAVPTDPVTPLRFQVQSVL